MAEQGFRRAGGPSAGIIAARPSQVSAGPVGEHTLGLGDERDGLLYVPPQATRLPLGLAVMFHGAGGEARPALDLLAPLADDAGLILLAPESRGPSWDVVRGGYGPDVAFIDEALALVFSRYAVDQRRIAVGGFSDGASYALSLGIMNGALFTHIIAFSPGFMAPLHQEGEPRIFISHGQSDEVLPIDTCSRRLVPLLEGAGYRLRYREFPGAHTVPPAIAREAMSWLIS
jgi:phospholipase/carboxylesterase